MSEPIYPDGNFLFIEDGGKTYQDGKAHWPALLRLQLNLRQALEVAERLVRSVRLAQAEGRTMPEITFSGSIERLENE